MGNLIRVVIVDTDYDGTILVPEECAHKHNTETCLHGEIDQKDYNRYMDLQKQIELDIPRPKPRISESKKLFAAGFLTLQCFRLFTYCRL